MIDKITEYLGSNKELTGSMVGFLLKPENLERLKDNKKLVKQLTKIKALPSSVRLYLRNLAGVTDKINEDFFSKSELKEIKKRVADAESESSMGNNAISGMTSTGSGRTNIIGYELDKGKLSFSKAFTDEATNIDMTLGQATFSKDDKGNFIVIDKHNFGPSVGGGTLYDNKEYFEGRKKNTKVIPHLDTAEKIDKMLFDYMDKPGDSENERKSNKFFTDLYKEGGLFANYKDNNTAESYTQNESNKQILERAKNAFEAGDIDASKYARIVAGFQQGEEIPIELNLGTISHEDKLKANPDFAEYIATDTLGSEEYKTRGKSYKDVGIPSLIRNYARKFMK